MRPGGPERTARGLAGRDGRPTRPVGIVTRANSTAITMPTSPVATRIDSHATPSSTRRPTASGAVRAPRLKKRCRRLSDRPRLVGKRSRISPLPPPSMAPAPRAAGMPAASRIAPCGGQPKGDEAQPQKRRGQRQDDPPADPLGDDPAAEGPGRIRDRVHEVEDPDPGIGLVERLLHGPDQARDEQPAPADEHERRAAERAGHERPGDGAGSHRARCYRVHGPRAPVRSAVAATRRAQPPRRAAAARTTSSRHGGPMSWTPIGSPSGDVPPRTTPAGQPGQVVDLAVRVGERRREAEPVRQRDVREDRADDEVDVPSSSGACSPGRHPRPPRAP